MLLDAFPGCRDGIVLSDDPPGNAGDDAKIWNIPGDHRIGTDNAVATDAAGEYRDILTKPSASTDDYRTFGEDGLIYNG